jgi:Ca-activated chloride channel family protein
VRPFFAAVFLVVGTAAGVTTQQPPLRRERPFQTDVEIISVTATVVDAEGRLVPGLGRDSFEIYEDGVPQTVSQFTNDRVPVGLGLVLDVSDSMYGQRIKDARAAVGRFLLELLDPADEFFVLAFNHQARLLTLWTNAPAVVRPRLDELRPSGGTAIYDAVLAALPHFDNRTRQRAALVVISDGADNSSDAGLRDVRSALVRSDAFAYAIAIDPPRREAINTAVNPWTLRQITDDSGGRTEVVHDTGDLGAATARIAEELNSQYVLGYYAPRKPDGQYHSIRVKVREAGHRVRARRGYVADRVARRKS